MLTGGARIVVPARWALTVYAAGTGGAENRRWWCINPDSSATPQPPLTTYASDACVISLIDLGKVLAFDPNGREGAAAEISCNNIHGAGETGVISDTVDLADTRTFGGSPSQFSSWTHVCEGYTLHGEQYLLPTSPNWDLFSNNADTTYAGVTVSSVMAGIAGSSTLPARTSTLWMGDRGYVRSVTKTATGMTIVIDRYQDCAVDQYVIRNDDTATTTYVVPDSAAVTGADRLTPGAKVSIATDGRIVTSVDYLDF